MTQQLTLAHQVAREVAERGMRRSLDAAESEWPQWADMASAYLRAYAARNEHFAGWMVVRAAANDVFFPAPPNAKAWGMVIRRAARAGLIEAAGMTTDPHRHSNPIVLWRSRIFDGGEATQK